MSEPVQETRAPSRRRTLARAGFVNFPVGNPRWRNTGEGGMFVKLVVVDDSDYDTSDWTICCGAGVYDLLSENFVGDDQAPAPVLRLKEGASPEETMAAMREHDKAYRAWEERHFPHMHDDGEHGTDKYMSRQYVASMVLGITGWSGFAEDLCEPWRCTFDDLTDDGKALYEQMRKLYPGCTLHLLTFLDT